MSTFARTDTSIVGRWWWTVDRWTLAAVAALLAVGAVLIMAASPAVAERIGLDSFSLVKRQFVLLPPAVALMFGVSLLSPLQVRRVATLGCLVAMALVVLTLVHGTEIKGARRWVNVGFSLQPSEFLKPTFAVVSAWLFSRQVMQPGFPGRLLCIGLYGLICALLLMQPDLGMTVVISVVWFSQFFLAGLPMFWVAVVSGMGGMAMVAAYLFLPHVTSRIDRFLDPSVGDSYQIKTALDAFRNGGLFGRGPGEGTVKAFLPDAHSDFVFAVAGEEFGLVVCILILGLFAFVVLRGFTRMLQEGNLFILMAVTGLLVQFGLQAVINMASSLHLMPTKGMTLPFLSFGGSSLLALALGMGMVLALTRRRVGGGDIT